MNGVRVSDVGSTKSSDVAQFSAVPVSRWFALVQVFLVCGVPTAFVVAATLFFSGSPMTAEGSLLTADPTKVSLEYFAMSSLFDTALVAILIRVFLTLSGETSRDVFIGPRGIGREAALGLAILPALFAVVIAVVAALGAWLPRLHNVPTNPLAAYMDTPLKAGLFIVVVILAGGVREELQRGFILHRFEQCLGGHWVGLAVFSGVFAVFHVPQGFDAAIAVGLLGVIWGVLYIGRRSVVMSMVSHAGFDALEVLQQLLVKTLGS